MDKLIQRIKNEYDFPPSVLEELEIIIKAWVSIGMGESKIKKELEQYDIYL